MDAQKFVWILKVLIIFWNILLRLIFFSILYVVLCSPNKFKITNTTWLKMGRREKRRIQQEYHALERRIYISELMIVMARVLFFSHQRRVEDRNIEESSNGSSLCISETIDCGGIVLYTSEMLMLVKEVGCNADLHGKFVLQILYNLFSYFSMATLWLVFNLAFSVIWS